MLVRWGGCVVMFGSEKWKGRTKEESRRKRRGSEGKRRGEREKSRRLSCLKVQELIDFVVYEQVKRVG